MDTNSRKNKKLRTLAISGDFKGDADDIKVEVILDKENKTLTIRDNGIGMSADEVDKYINQIAFSGAGNTCPLLLALLVLRKTLFLPLIIITRGNYSQCLVIYCRLVYPEITRMYTMLQVNTPCSNNLIKKYNMLHVAAKMPMLYCDLYYTF